MCTTNMSFKNRFSNQKCVITFCIVFLLVGSGYLGLLYGGFVAELVWENVHLELNL